MHARGRYDASTSIYIWIDPHSTVVGSAPPHHIHPPVHPIHPFDGEIIPCKSATYATQTTLICTRAAGIDLPAPKCPACVAPQPRPAREAAPWAAARPADRARSGAQDTGARCHPSCVCACAMLRCIHTWSSIHPSIDPSTPSTCLPTYLPIYPPINPSTSQYQHREA